MSLAPTRQFRPPYLNDSMHSSLVKLHTASQLRFFRYASSSSLDKRTSCSFWKVTSSEPRGRRLRPKGSNFAPRDEGGNWRSNGETSSSRSSCSASSSSGNWLDMWSKNRLPNSPKPPGRVVNYRNTGAVRVSNVSNWGSKRLGSSSGGESVGGGGGGSSTMDKIVEKLKKFGYMEDERDTGVKIERRIEKGSVEDIFYVEDGVLPNTRGGFSDDSPLGVKRYAGGDDEARFPWEKPVELPEEVKNSVRKKSRTSVAELTIPEPELRRLKYLSMNTKQKVKVGGGGVTHSVVDAIHEKWKDSEIVRVKVEGSSALNMRRIHVILERKTGGLVIWRSGTSVALYRGISYNVPSENMIKRTFEKNGYDPNLLPTYPNESIRVSQKPNSYDGVHPLQERPQGNKDEIIDSEFSNEVTYEDEIDELLADLGPRYEDWPGGDPLPVDADMLPSVVPGYQPPFRLLPYGVRASISVKEATALRRIARTLPPHFALGRNRQLQGLATAMVKLWAKSSIAKVSLKRGVQVTTSERMAEDIKRLTGGMLLSRNKDFLVFYRGKNFLSPDVAEALLERERLAMSLQDEEELARLRSPAMVFSTAETAEQSVAAGTLEETLNADAQWGKKLDDSDKENALREAEKLKHAKIVKRLERKLVMAEKKLMKAEHALAKVEGFLNPSDREADPNSITDEERFMFRKLGLKMKAFLLLGRRGVFDGTIENMHLHWKYRELVKIIVKVKSFEEVKMIALSLEAESGGVLVSVDKVSKGYAVVVFRGKEYQRPSMLRPQNLLTKRKALARSVELQRREALLKHIATMQRNVGKLRSEIGEVETMKGEGDTEFYDKIDSAYPSEEEDSEEEGDDSYLMTFNSDSDEEEDGGSKFANILNSDTNSDPYHEQFTTDREEEYRSSYAGDDSESNGDEEQQRSSPELPWDIEEEAETGPNP